jgi:hypothetical protein
LPSLKAAAAAAALITCAVSALAHTMTCGYFTGANLGEIEFWFGSYHTPYGDIPSKERCRWRASGALCSRRLRRIS